MSTHYKLSTQARARTIADEGVVVLQKDAEVLITNAAGAAMLEMFREGTTLDSLASMLQTRFGAAAEQAASDANAFIKEMSAAGAVEEVASQ